MGRGPALQGGDLLAGKYRLEQVLGTGGMGVVMAATHLHLGRMVAVKFMLPDKASDAESVERFAREARATVRLKSEHVTRILDVGTLDNGSPYLVMEYLEGTDLATIVRCDGPLPVAVAADYIIQALDALGEAHAMGIVHRDLKPSNLFITRRADGSAWLKVLDFGISKLASHGGDASLTGTHSIIGSPAYMSPENLWSSKLVDVRSDIWSLGIILYELVSGRAPFSAPAFSTLVLKVALEPLPSLSGPEPIPAGFAAIVRRCLEKDPSRRFESAAELAAALEPFAPAGAVLVVDRIRRLKTEPEPVLRGTSTWIASRSLQQSLSPSSGTPPVLSPISSATRTSRPKRLDAALSSDARRRTRRRLLAASMVLTLSIGGLALHRLHSESHGRLVRLHTEQGRLAVLSGDPMRGLVYLGEAYRAGARGPALDVLLGAASSGLAAEIFTLHDPDGSVGMPEFSPDGRRILTSNDDETSRIWDDSGALLTTLHGTGPRGWTGQSAFSGDGTRIAVRRAGTSEVDVRAVSTGAVLHTLSGHAQGVTAIVHSPQDRRVLTVSSDATARIWSTETGALESLLSAGAPLVCGDWSPDARRVVTGAVDGALHLWDAGTGQLIRTWRGHRQQVQAARFSSDGTRIATASWDSTARIWDVASSAPLFTLRHERPLDDAQFSPDGTRLATSSQDFTAKVWDVHTGALLHSLDGHSGPVFVARFSRDGERILTTGGDETARLWDAGTGDPVWTYAGALWSASFDPDGRRVATAGIDGAARVWDADVTLYQVALRGHSDRVASARFSPDGTRVLTASLDRTIKLWDAATGRRLASTPSEPTAQLFVSWSPDGSRFLTISDRIATIWDVRTMRALLHLVGHSAPLWPAGRAGFSPDGTKVVTGSADRTARIWDARTGRELLRLHGHRASVNSAEFSASGELIVTASDDNTARVWDATSGALRLEFRGHADDLTSAIFDRAGTRVLTTSSDRTARVWDARSGALLVSLEGHTHQVNRSDFHPGGALIVTSSIDGTARLWDAHDGRLLSIIREPWLSEATFSADGRRILTASRNTTAKLWEVPRLRASPDEMFRLIRCRVPFRVAGDRLAVAKTDPRACSASRDGTATATAAAPSARRAGRPRGPEGARGPPRAIHMKAHVQVR
jgi:WD40 repeat protein/serine/threonine protein kinase